MANDTRSLTKEEKYLYEVFNLLKKRESLALSAKDTNFSETEFRLMAEIVSAKVNGKRLISTQLAKLLGITRSAVSQIVNRLESEGIVARISDAVDRKIAYIELTDKTLEKYGEDVQKNQRFIGNVVNRFGEENFYTMCSLFQSFVDAIEKEKNMKNTDR